MARQTLYAFGGDRETREDWLETFYQAALSAGLDKMDAALEADAEWKRLRKAGEIRRAA